MVIFRFGLLSAVKLLSRAFYSFEVDWVGRRPSSPFQDIRLGLLLNHTSLMEPIYLAAVPFRLLWEAASQGVMPGADVTMNRPIVGRFYKAMVPHPVTVTRKRDHTWAEFLKAVGEGSSVWMAPEGRMMRANGLDKQGKPMSVRGGVADVLASLSGGKILLAYAGGLHHIQTPGQGLPKLFKRARIRFEEISIPEYKAEMGFGERKFRLNVVRDLEARRDRHCPR